MGTREGSRPTNLSGGRWLGSDHGRGWKARGGEWVGPGDAREGERAKGVERGLGGGVKSPPRGRPWTRRTGGRGNGSGGQERGREAVYDIHGSLVGRQEERG